jgi:hypothetical protein
MTSRFRERLPSPPTFSEAIDNTRPRLLQIAGLDAGDGAEAQILTLALAQSEGGASPALPASWLTPLVYKEGAPTEADAHKATSKST